MIAENQNAVYACVNFDETFCSEKPNDKYISVYDIVKKLTAAVIVMTTAAAEYVMDVSYSFLSFFHQGVLTVL